MNKTHATEISLKAAEETSFEPISLEEAMALVREGDAYNFLGLLEDAFECYLRVPREHQLPYRNSLINRMTVATALDWREIALQTAEEGLGCGIEDYHLMEKCAVVFQIYGKPERALEEYSKYLLAKGLNARLALCIGYAKADAGKYREAVMAFFYCLHSYKDASDLEPLSWDYELQGLWKYVAGLQLDDSSAQIFCNPCWLRVSSAARGVGQIGIDRRMILGYRQEGIELPPLVYKPEHDRFFVRPGLKGAEAKLARAFTNRLEATRSENADIVETMVSRARELLSDYQFSYASRRCEAGDHYAAMMHIICGLASRPHKAAARLATFRSLLPQLEAIGDFLDDLAGALAVAPDFCQTVMNCRDLAFLGMRQCRDTVAARVSDEIGHLRVVRWLKAFAAEFDGEHAEALTILQKLIAEGCDWSAVSFPCACLLGVQGRHSEGLAVLRRAHPSWTWNSGAQLFTKRLLACDTELQHGKSRICAPFGGQEDTGGLSLPLNNPPPSPEDILSQ